MRPVVRSSSAIICGLGFLLLAAGCESFGNHRGGVAKDAMPDITEREPADPAKESKAKTSWTPGSWSGEARDIEKNMMRNSVNPNW